ncbi:MAG: class II aldolase/adducin family protein [Planctomycetota bacterium]|jgi:rhamnose utilization protein RhaD (predicted bifunctional aldolase and dehydrogenase)|nr:class II aldolase/adducin family protein [Planctomycetota bacterium]
MPESDDLAVITELSHEFGVPTYVRGGGGNTSVKDASTLWIKPSGTSLGEMTRESFIPMSREKLAGLYQTTFPTEDKARESAVKDFIATTLLPGATGRPSVEAPLHNSFPQRFVVHTHPSLVNGMTCGKNGRTFAATAFPQALWVDFIEPGYTLSQAIRKEMLAYAERTGSPPEILFLGNHGVFIAHDTAAGIRSLYQEVMTKISARVSGAGFAGDPEKGPEPSPAAQEAAKRVLASVLGADASEIVAAGHFSLPTGAISPDHIVYCKSYMYRGEISAAGLTAYQARYGVWPRVAEASDAVYGFGSSRKVADLALEMAWDAALIVRYAQAFGGIQYLSERFVKFIEGWEVESYRQRLTQ